MQPACSSAEQHDDRHVLLHSNIPPVMLSFCRSTCCPGCSSSADFPYLHVFYGPEAANLGDRIRLWARARVRQSLSLGFSWTVESAPGTSDDKVLCPLFDSHGQCGDICRQIMVRLTCCKHGSLCGKIYKYIDAYIAICMYGIYLSMLLDASWKDLPSISVRHSHLSDRLDKEK